MKKIISTTLLLFCFNFCQKPEQIFDPLTNIEFFSNDSCISFFSPENAEIKHLENKDISIFYMRWAAYIDVLENEESNTKLETLFQKIYKSASKSLKDLKFQKFEIILNETDGKELYFKHSRIYDGFRTSGSSRLLKIGNIYYHVYSELFYPENLHPSFVTYYLEWPKKVNFRCK
ncbi:hypothetical protein AB3N60_10270 [Leptospira sp. WS39.C2]